MSDRITEVEYAHYCSCYAAVKTGSAMPVPQCSTPREAVLSALAVDDAKSVLGVLPCAATEDGRHLVDLHTSDLNGSRIATLHYPRGYDVQEILATARAMVESAHMKDIDNVSARLHAVLKR